jgi:hypothetical protein
MIPWLEDFARPSDLQWEQWFSRLAGRLLNQTHLIIAGEPHRLVDIEIYYQSSEHPDPFAHADPIQAETGRWYFHRSHDVYRGGSFKGVDITFGSDLARAGILIRGIVSSQGKVVDGPSLVVDYLLSRTRSPTVAHLDAAIGSRRIWDGDSPLSLIGSAAFEMSILSCARVGLSLRRARLPGAWTDYLLKPYRFVSDPSNIRKGRAQMVISRHRAKYTEEDVSRSIGCPSRVIRRYITEYEAGLATGQFEDYFGNVLRANDVCRLHGVADRCNQELPFFDSSSR